MRYLMILPVVLAGCAEPAPQADTCGATALQVLVGEPADALAAYQFRGTMRVVPPDSVVTLDFNPARINVALDSVGLITGVTCG